MKVPFVDLKLQYQNHRESIDAAIESVIAETAFIRGKYVDGFREQFAEAIGTTSCVPCANGTDAILIALKMLGIGQGDEVITTANSWISTSETITAAGARVVFVDTDERTFNMDPAKIEEKITSRTKAILPVHLMGQSADMGAIMDIAGRHGLLVVEDCAQAHLATWEGQTVGTFGSAGTFSFYPGKNLGAYGDAGAIVTNDQALAEKMHLFANHGADPTNKHNHKIEGISSRLDGLQAAILSAKLPHLADWSEQRRRAAAAYSERLADIPEVKAPYVDSRAVPVFHVYSLRVERRDELQAHLSEQGIATGRHYPTPLPFLDAYAYLGHTRDDFPVASAHQGEMLSLPIYPEISTEQIDHVVEAIRSFFA